MKACLITLTILGCSIMFVEAKQDMTANPRFVSQATGLTAGDQSNKPADISMVRKIRKELMEDDSLSTRAKNIKVIVLNNGITLKGEVISNSERARILEHAYTSAPKFKIYNQISVTK